MCTYLETCRHSSHVPYFLQVHALGAQHTNRQHQLAVNLEASSCRGNGAHHYDGLAVCIAIAWSAAGLRGCWGQAGCILGIAANITSRRVCRNEHSRGRSQGGA